MTKHWAQLQRGYVQTDTLNFSCQHTTLLVSAPKNVKQISRQQKKRLTEKQYDTTSHPLKQLAEGQVVRLQRIKGTTALAQSRRFAKSHTRTSSNPMEASTGGIVSTFCVLPSCRYLNGSTLQTLVPIQLTEPPQTLSFLHYSPSRYIDLHECLQSIVASS